MSIKDKHDYQGNPTNLEKILSDVTRLEIIGVTREYVKHNIMKVEPSLQDGGRTLKLFIH